MVVSWLQCLCVYLTGSSFGFRLITYQHVGDKLFNLPAAIWIKFSRATWSFEFRYSMNFSLVANPLIYIAPPRTMLFESFTFDCYTWGYALVHRNFTEYPKPTKKTNQMENPQSVMGFPWTNTRKPISVCQSISWDTGNKQKILLKQ